MLTRFHALSFMACLGVAALLSSCATTPLGGGSGQSSGWQSSDALMSYIAQKMDKDQGSLNVSSVEGRLLGGREEYRVAFSNWPAVGTNESYYKWGMTMQDYAEEHAAVAERGMGLIQKQIFKDAAGVTRVQAVWTAPE